METPLKIKLPETKIAEIANSVDLDEAAHNLNLHFLPYSL